MFRINRIAESNKHIVYDTFNELLTWNLTRLKSEIPDLVDANCNFVIIFTGSENRIKNIAAIK